MSFSTAKTEETPFPELQVYLFDQVPLGAQSFPLSFEFPVFGFKFILAFPVTGYLILELITCQLSIP
jgi:hypothetical protein